jgi:hypothetical protein
VPAGQSERNEGDAHADRQSANHVYVLLGCARRGRNRSAPAKGAYLPVAADGLIGITRAGQIVPG